MRALDQLRNLSLSPAVSSIRAAVVSVFRPRSPEAPMSDSERIIQLCEGGSSDAVRNLLRNAPKGSLTKAAALALIQADQGGHVAAYLDKFHDLDHKEIALALIQANQGVYVAHYLDKFHDLDHKEIALALIQANQGVYVAAYLDKFHDLDHKEIALALIQAGNSLTVAYHLHDFHGLDQEVALALIQADRGEYVAKYLKNFHGLDQEVALALIQAGNSLTVAYHLHDFHGLDQEVALALIQADRGEYVAKYLKNFHGLDKEVALALIEKGEGRALVEHISSFVLTLDDKSTLFAAGIVYGPLYKYDGKHLSPLHEQGYEIFGDAFDGHDFEVLEKLQAGDISAEAAETGITQTGAAGIRQLREILGAFTAPSLHEDESLFTQLEQPGLVQKRYLKLIRYETSEWGKHDQDSFAQIVSTTRERAEQDPHALEAAPEYIRAELQITELAELAKEYEYSEAGTQRYSQLRESLQLAVLARETPQPLQQLIGQLESSIDGIIAQLESKLANLPDKLWAEGKDDTTIQKVLAAQQREISELRAVNLRRISDWQQLLPKLARYPELQPALRALAAVFACREHAGLADRIRALPEHPSLESIGAVMDIAQHVVYKETIASWAADKSARTAAKNLWNVSALEQEQAAIQRSRAGAGQRGITCLPTRGLLMEFSGHISDACWASQYESIAKAFPNFTFIAFVENPETPNQKLSGGAFLIETESKTGEPLLIIRGLNPVESLTRDIDPADFCQRFFGYSAGIAKSRGRKLAVVIDPCAAASTNRPLVHAYLESIKSNLEKVQLKSEAGTTFNGYDITGKAYLLS